jgi:hypothetical protein
MDTVRAALEESLGAQRYVELTDQGRTLSTTDALEIAGSLLAETCGQPRC